MPKIVKYISHGDLPDGGYRHEKYFAESLSKFLRVPFEEKRKWRLYKGLSNLSLQLWGMLHSNSDHNVLVARLGVLSWLRNITSNRKSYVIVHDYDKNRYNSLYLRVYYPLLFGIFRWFKPKRLKLVVISEYWVKYFNEEKGIPKENIILFPNLIDTKEVIARRSKDKENWIHLGQLSKKNSEDIYKAAEELTKLGYYCYFSSLDKKSVCTQKYYAVEYFDSYASYLGKMAKSQFTLAFSKYHEGWNRVVHESALLNTPVIGYKMGGMKFLIEESGNVLVDSWTQSIERIKEGINYTCSDEFCSKYDISQADYYLGPLENDKK